jgi:hypothetical protein
LKIITDTNTGNGRVPRRGERVTLKGENGIFAVLRIHNQLQTVDLKLIGRTGSVLKDIRWEALSFLNAMTFESS